MSGLGSGGSWLWTARQDGPRGKDEQMQRVTRPRRYVPRHWVMLLRPVLRYSHMRDAYVLRGVGSSVGPVLRIDRREDGSRQHAGPERRSARIVPPERRSARTA